MTEVLSQHEIDTLLLAINAGDTSESEEFKPAADCRKIKIYDFKRPDKFTKNQIRAISIVHEDFCRNVTNKMSNLFTGLTHIHCASVDQLTYEEYVRSIPTPTTISIVETNSSMKTIEMEIDPAITFAMMKNLLGSENDSNFREQHELTTIEQKIMEYIVQSLFLPTLNDCWKNYDELNTELVKIKTYPNHDPIARWGDMVILVTIETKINEIEGMINICYPARFDKNLMFKLNNWSLFQGEKLPNLINSDPTKEEKEEFLKWSADAMEIECQVVLGNKKITIEELKHMDEGTILELDKLAGEPVDIYIQNKKIAQGEVIVIDETYGVRVTDIMRPNLD